jgi:putative nucleotidyltransferase with HDIG domain
MLLQPTVGDESLLAETLERDTKALTRRERTTEMLVTAAFFAAVAGLFAVRPPHGFDVLPAVLCVLVLGVATRVQFHIASGFTVPTQLGFVPLLFVVPVAVAPLAVAVALALARLPEVLRRQAAPGRLVHAFGNSWFAIGPAVVLAACDTEAWRASIAVLALALVAQFAVDFTVSSARAAIESGADLREQLNETWIYAVDAALSPAALAIAAYVHHRPAAALGLLPLLGVFGFFARERRARLESLLELKNAYQGTALVLGDVVEADDGYTGEHCKSVVRLALEVGSQLRLDPERLRNLEFGALLHDVGKVAIPKEIINKPDKLDPHEWQIVKTHTVEGQRMLERVGGFMRTVGLIVRSHHERWDGGGYPDGLYGEEIPLESRIIACCDSWNAMRTTRPYKKAMPHHAALDELVANAGRQFDPNIVDVLLEVVANEAPSVADMQAERASEAPQLTRPRAEMPEAPTLPASPMASGDLTARPNP